MTTDRIEQAKTAADVLSIGVVVATIAQLLPSIAALLSVIWLCIQISQSHRFAQFVGLVRRAYAAIKGGLFK